MPTDELQALRRRIDIVLTALGGRSVEETARQCRTSRPTVSKWLKRFRECGIAGLLSGVPSGRPSSIHPAVRRELLRLPYHTRPPLARGDQWTANALGQVFGLHPATVSLVWQSGRFDAPQHLRQVEIGPDRGVPLRLEARVPAWFKLHLELFCRERDLSLEEHVINLICGPDGWRELREDVLPSLRPRWYRVNDNLPRVDPRHPAYRARLGREDHHAS